MPFLTTKFVKFLKERNLLGQAVDGIVQLVETSNDLMRVILMTGVVLLGSTPVSANPR